MTIGAKIFPFTLAYNDTGHSVFSPDKFRDILLKNKPKNLNWHAYDVEIISPTKIKFIVYDIRVGFGLDRYDSVKEKVGQFIVDDVDPRVTESSIHTRILNLAQVEFNRREDVRVGKEILKLAQQIAVENLYLAEELDAKDS